MPRFPAKNLCPYVDVDQPKVDSWMYIMDAQVGLKTIALTLFMNLFFHILPAAALCHDFSLVDSVETLNGESNSL